MVKSKLVNLSIQQVFAALSPEAWCIFLQSGQSIADDNARYDILAADPIASLCFQEQHCLQQLGDAFEQIDSDPFEQAQTLRERLFPNVENYADELPFCGGALGLWSYDLGRTQERLPELCQQDLNTPEMALGYYDWCLCFDHQRQQTRLIVCASSLDSNLDAKLAQREQWLLARLAQAESEAKPTRFKLSSPWQSNLSKAEYAQRFAKVHDYLLSGDCYQINLTQRFSAKYQGSELEAYQRLVEVNQSPFSCFMRLAQSCVLSISPERFIGLKGQQIETKPIKGTRSRGQSLEQDNAQVAALLNSEKDRAENLMIVDLLRNDIGRVAEPSSVKVPAIFQVESYPAVHHLVSTVTATLPKTSSPEQLLAACFPGGSITGAPKIRAMEIIEELEPHRRNAYCGSMGYISANGNMDSNITIRTLVCEQGKIYVWAGGGIVMDSECEAEYQESFDKLSRILPVLSELNAELEH